VNVGSVSEYVGVTLRVTIPHAEREVYVPKLRHYLNVLLRVLLRGGVDDTIAPTP